MSILNLKVSTMIFRLHLMSALVVTMGFIGHWIGAMFLLYAGIVLGIVIFLATLMGIKWSQIDPFHHLPKETRHTYDWHRHHHTAHH